MRLRPSETSSAIVFIDRAVKIIIMPTKFKSFEEFGKSAREERVQGFKQQIDSRNDFSAYSFSFHNCIAGWENILTNRFRSL